jgi:hypothetical protein
VFQQSISKVQGSIQQISSYAHLWISRVQNIKLRLRHAHVIHMLDMAGTLRARALKGAHAAPLTRRAQRVALVIGIALCLPMGTANSGSIKPYTSLKQLADYQLTHKQYKCHNEIVYRESRFKHDAVNGSHYGYYQIRSKSLHKAPYDYQFYRYWSYVLHRYGYTEYDEPDYCKALHHLKTKGWQ